MKAFTLYSIVFLFLSSGVYAQKEYNQNMDYGNDPSFLFLKNAEFYKFSAVANNSQKEIENKSLANGIIIQQVGKFDQVDINVKGKKISIAAVQEGDNNKLSLYKNGAEINQKILQEGNRNTIQDYTFYTTNNVNMEMVQRGDNLQIKNFGSNSISNNMKVTQLGKGANVIILNTK
jgi:minor curlin subunit